MSLSQMPFWWEGKLFKSHLAEEINHYIQYRTILKLGFYEDYNSRIIKKRCGVEPAASVTAQTSGILSANINLRKAQAVVNILLKAIRLGTWQHRHIPGSGAGKDVCVDYGLQGFWPKIYAWLHSFLINFSIWKLRRFLISIYMLSLTRGRSNSFWIKLLHQKLSPTTRTVKHGWAVLQRRIICHMLNLILRSHFIIQSRMLIRSAMINKC